MSLLAAKKGWRSRTHNNKMNSMLTAGGQLFRRMGSLLPQHGQTPKCVQTYFYGGDEATKWHMLNTKKNFSSGERGTYQRVFKNLHNILTTSQNKYIDSFLGVKQYVEKHLKNKVWDVKLSIHANESPGSLTHKGRLNAPTVNEIAILLPSNDVLTKNHKRLVNCNLCHFSTLTFLTTFLIQICHCQLQTTRKPRCIALHTRLSQILWLIAISLHIS